MARSLKKGYFIDDHLEKKVAAMNPIDHPHGGGEGRTGTKRDPVSPWGVLTKGYRTRNNKRTKSMIVQTRHKKK